MIRELFAIAPFCPKSVDLPRLAQFAAGPTIPSASSFVVHPLLAILVLIFGAAPVLLCSRANVGAGQAPIENPWIYA
jgi:hypothetical protein